MGYNGSNRRPKFDVGSKRDAKRMSKLVASIITAPLAVGASGKGRKSSSSDTTTPKEEAVGVFIVALVFTLIILHWTGDLFRSGHIVGGIILVLFIPLMWWIVYLAKKAADKDK